MATVRRSLLRKKNSNYQPADTAALDFLPSKRFIASSHLPFSAALSRLTECIRTVMKAELLRPSATTVDDAWPPIPGSPLEMNAASSVSSASVRPADGAYGTS